MWPQRAYASVAFDHFNIQGGKNTLDWGNGKSGNLLLSDAPEELSYIQASTWWNVVKFTSLWTFLDNSRPQLTDPTNPNSPPRVFPISPGNGTDYFYAQTPNEVLPARLFLSHRLEFRMGERMNMIFTEAMIYQDYWNNASFLNPFYLFHNTYLTGHGDYFLSIDIEIALLPGWSLYSQILLDQVSALGLNRIGEGEDAIPGSIPVLLGTQYVKPFDTGYLSWAFEFIKIDPYSYLDRSDVFLGQNRRWLTSFDGNSAHLLVTQPLGYFLGNDLIRLWTNFKWEEPFFYSAWLESALLFKGENTLQTPWSKAPGEAQKRAASGNVRTEIAVGVGGEIFLERWLGGQEVRLTTHLMFLETHFLGNWEWDIQFALGISWAY
jgi:hypothetical protein